jgi:uncharacterized tellurite resistance protein B-like protein
LIEISLALLQLSRYSARFNHAGANAMDWPGFVKNLILADGRVNEVEAELLERACLDAGHITKELLELLLQLKRQATWVHPKFDALLFRVLQAVMLRDGVIHDSEAHWLRKLILRDNQIVEEELTFVSRLHQGPNRFGPEFTKLHQECTRLQGHHFGE